MLNHGGMDQPREAASTLRLDRLDARCGQKVVNVTCHAGAHLIPALDVLKLLNLPLGALSIRRKSRRCLLGPCEP